MREVRRHSLRGIAIVASARQEPPVSGLFFAFCINNAHQLPPPAQKSQRVFRVARTVDRHRAPGSGHVFLRWMLAAVVCGTVLRFSALSRLAVEHYDEGVYASNLVFLASEGNEFPGRAMFSPPLWPAVIETADIVGYFLTDRLPRWWPMLPGLLCGVALVPSVAWMMRRWFGSAAGLAAAWLVALSEYHAFYSRTALTDAPLMLAWLWAVAWIAIALERNDLRSAVIAGAITALGWWTKYNGWLPLAIGLSGGAAAQLMLPPNERSWQRYGRTVAVVIATAVVLWLPVLWDCREVGGYSAVARNHMGYSQPWSQWWNTLVHQGENLDTYLGAITACGLLVPAIMAVVAHCLRKDGLSSRVTTISLGGTAALAGIFWLTGLRPTLSVLLAGSLGGIALGLWRWRRRELSATEILAACLLSAWFFGLLLATPRYHAYPRLVMPLWLAGCLATAWLVAQLSDGRHQQAPTENRGQLSRFAPFVTAAVILSLMAVAPIACWEDRTKIAKAADDIAAQLAKEHGIGSPAVVYVYAEPALFLHLREAGVAAVLRGDLGFAAAPAATPTYHIAGLFTQLDAGYQTEWQQRNRFETVRSWTFEPSSLKLLDYFSPKELRDRPQERERTLTLYRVRP